jgi:hypothetical protein
MREVEIEEEVFHRFGTFIHTPDCRVKGASPGTCSHLSSYFIFSPDHELSES